MPVVAFYTHCKDQTGNTVSAIALATYLGITQNKKTLLISTAYKDKTVRESFWTVEEKKKSGLFGPNTQVISQSGIEDLDRIVRSNRISPDIITNYTRVALRGRLEIIDSFNGSMEQYEQIQNNYSKIASLANKYYDTVIVDIDKKLLTKNKLEILNISDIVIAMTTQKVHNINEIKNIMDGGKVFNKDNTLITLGRYDEKMKYNAKNLSRSVLKQKKIINTIPYNSLVFEAIQEGKIIDVIWKLLNLKNRDENYLLIQELQRLNEDIDDKVMALRMKK